MASFTKSAMMWRWCRVVFLVVAALCGCRAADVTVSPPSRQVEVCSGQTFSARCPPGQVIMIDNARYGRMRAGPCKVTNVGVGCYGDAILYVESFCAGRRSCSFVVSDDFRQKLDHGCGEDLLGYLELEYYCQPVYEGSKNSCKSREPDIVSTSSGYIASVVTMESGKGAVICPWIIKVTGTQTINLTLVDFGVWSNTKDQNPSSTCTIYALVYIANFPEPQTLCSGRSRQRALFTLNGRKDIRIVMTNSSAQLPYYLINFEVRETRACPEYEPQSPQEKITSPSNDTIQVQCPHGSPETTLTLKCTDGQWISESGRKNCGITPDSSSTTVVAPASAHVSATAGQGILIAMAVALSCCFLIIAIGIVCYLKRKSARPNQNLEPPCPYGMAHGYSQATLPFDMYDRTLGPRAVSQKDLCLQPIQVWPRTPNGLQRDYATTIEMRRGLAPGYGYTCGPHQHPGMPPPQQQEVWTTCPVHGTGTYGRRQANHIYDMPIYADEMFLPGGPGAGGRGPQQGVATLASPEEPGCMSPFYHELDPLSMASGNEPTSPAATSTETNCSTAPFAKI